MSKLQRQLLIRQCGKLRVALEQKESMLAKREERVEAERQKVRDLMSIRDRDMRGPLLDVTGSISTASDSLVHHMNSTEQRLSKVVGGVSTRLTTVADDLNGKITDAQDSVKSTIAASTAAVEREVKELGSQLTFRQKYFETFRKLQILQTAHRKLQEKCAEQETKISEAQARDDRQTSELSKAKEAAQTAEGKVQSLTGDLEERDKRIAVMSKAEQARKDEALIAEVEAQLVHQAAEIERFRMERAARQTTPKPTQIPLATPTRGRSSPRQGVTRQGSVVPAKRDLASPKRTSASKRSQHDRPGAPPTHQSRIPKPANVVRSKGKSSFTPHDRSADYPMEDAPATGGEAQTRPAGSGQSALTGSRASSSTSPAKIRPVLRQKTSPAEPSVVKPALRETVASGPSKPRVTPVAKAGGDRKSNVKGKGRAKNGKHSEHQSDSEAEPVSLDEVLRALDIYDPASSSQGNRKPAQDMSSDLLAILEPTLELLQDPHLFEAVQRKVTKAETRCGAQRAWRYPSHVARRMLDADQPPVACDDCSAGDRACILVWKGTRPMIVPRKGDNLDLTEASSWIGVRPLEVDDDHGNNDDEENDLGGGA